MSYFRAKEWEHLVRDIEMPATLNKTVVLTTLAEKQRELRKFGVAQIGLFGSFVHNRQQADSDLDFLVEFIPGKKNFRNFMNLAFYLEDLFDRRVEIVTNQSLSPHIGPHIISEVEYAAL